MGLKFTNVLKFVFGVVIILICGMQRASASHALGADITYRQISGLQYEITVTFYRDCAGIPVRNMTLTYSSTACGSYSNTVTITPGTGIELTQTCSPLQKTTCAGGTVTGIQKYPYTAIITLPWPCSDWTFSMEEPARNCAITTIVKPNPCNSSNSPPNLYVEAKLDNLNFSGNDSPLFTNRPFMFVCVGQSFTYNPGVVSTNGDSVSYQLINAKQNGTTGIQYLNP
jgi:hypothetical protein